jgi:cystathionine gamma-synthase
MARTRTNDYSNAVINPIYQTSTYYFESTDQVIQYHLGQTKIGRYARYDNPSWLEIERKLAALDYCEEALVFPSGMSAIATTLLSILEAKDRLIFTGKGYRNIRKFCFDILDKFDAEVLTLPLLDSEDIYELLAKQYTSHTKAVLIESPSNPHMFLVDLGRVREIIGNSCILIVDSTFSSPVNFKPKLYGADLVIHSCGKYVGGHGDIMAGSVAGNRDLIDKIRQTRNVMGSILDPNTAFLLNRSISSLELRMKHLNHAGQKLAEYLDQHEYIGKVYYTGLKDHPQYDLAKQYLSGHGGVITFEIKAGKEEVSEFVDSVEIPFMGTSFGLAHSMIEQLSIFTYFKQSEVEKKDLGIADNMVRYGIGIEDDIEAIIYDIDHSLTKVLNSRTTVSV